MKFLIEVYYYYWNENDRIVNYKNKIMFNNRPNSIVIIRD